VARQWIFAAVRKFRPVEYFPEAQLFSECRGTACHWKKPSSAPSNAVFNPDKLASSNIT
jgi:hypothetical protein